MIQERPLRILALHGYQGNSIRFAKKTAPLRNALQESAEIVYLTAPHLVERFGEDMTDVEDKEAVDGQIEVNGEFEWARVTELKQYAWWPSSGTENEGIRRFAKSLEFLKKALEQDGPFDGVLGFSQGASLAGFLCALLENPAVFPLLSSPIRHPPFRIFLSFCGFPAFPRNSAFCHVRPIHTNSLHIISRADKLVPVERAKKFAGLFVGSKEVYYEEGHFVPMDPGFLEIYKDFITKSTGLSLIRSQL